MLGCLHLTVHMLGGVCSVLGNFGGDCKGVHARCALLAWQYVSSMQPATDPLPLVLAPPGYPYATCSVPLCLADLRLALTEDEARRIEQHAGQAVQLHCAGSSAATGGKAHNQQTLLVVAAVAKQAEAVCNVHLPACVVAAEQSHAWLMPKAVPCCIVA